ncbi:MAG: hypothetical protein [Caudoviricetes sp.]|nr:MAG: hypothetical protein [Caudoviricetes sp.]
MNVMTQAHKMVKATLAKITTRYKGQYANMFKLALKVAHEEYKAMIENCPVAKMIKSTETYIAELEAALLDREAVQGFIITTGQGRICVDAHEGKATNVLCAPVYMTVSKAECYAEMVRNGNGEVGEVRGKYSQLKYELEQQQELLNDLKKV